jgi:hypothetical protein
MDRTLCSSGSPIVVSCPTVRLYGSQAQASRDFMTESRFVADEWTPPGNLTLRVSATPNEPAHVRN